jgi:hypothetical protein
MTSTACNSQGQTGPDKNITNIEENNSPLAVVSGSVVKRVHYISEMSQNYACLSHRGVAS